jgi:hypothetical protein
MLDILSSTDKDDCREAPITLLLKFSGVTSRGRVSEVRFIISLRCDQAELGSEGDKGIVESDLGAEGGVWVI